MADTRLRELQTRWFETGYPEARQAYLKERLRTGDLTRACKDNPGNQWSDILELLIDPKGYEFEFRDEISKAVQSFKENYVNPLREVVDRISQRGNEMEFIGTAQYDGFFKGVSFSKKDIDSLLLDLTIDEKLDTLKDACLIIMEAARRDVAHGSYHIFTSHLTKPFALGNSRSRYDSFHVHGDLESVQNDVMPDDFDELYTIEIICDGEVKGIYTSNTDLKAKTVSGVMGLAAGSCNSRIIAQEFHITGKGLDVRIFQPDSVLTATGSELVYFNCTNVDFKLEQNGEFYPLKPRV